jgi:hypothetical protein
MSNIRNINDKQKEKLKNSTLEEKALAAARRAREEFRKYKNIQEPDQLASGKSDKNGQMIVDTVDVKEDIRAKEFLKDEEE